MSLSARVPSYEEPRPAWRPVLAGTFVGYLIAFALTGVAAIVLVLIGALGRSRVGAGAGGTADFLDWPYRGDGAWNALTNLTVAAALVATAAFCVRDSVRVRVGRDVSARAVAVIVFFTGYVPFARWPGSGGSSFLFAFLLTAALVKWFALAPVSWDEPRRQGLRALLRRPRGRAAALVGAIGLGSVVAYGLAHPLWTGSVTPIGGVADGTAFTGERAARGSYGLSVVNDGWLPVTVTDVEAVSFVGPSRLLELVDVRAGPAEGNPPWPLDPARPFDEARLAGHSERTFELVFRFDGCRGLGGAFSVDEVRVRYRIVGTAQSVRVPLAPAPSVRCP